MNDAGYKNNNEQYIGHSISPGGKGTNQAVGVAKLNHKVTLLGNVGNDLDVGLIYSCLEEHGIDSSGIHRDRSVNTGKAYIQIQDDGESIITLLTGANATLTAQTLRNNRHFFENCAYCLLQTEIAIEAVEEAVLIAKENNVKTILKPAAVSSLSENILKHTDILIPITKQHIAHFKNKNKAAAISSESSLPNGISLLLYLYFFTLINIYTHTGLPL